MTSGTKSVQQTSAKFTRKIASVMFASAAVFATAQIPFPDQLQAHAAPGTPAVTERLAIHSVNAVAANPEAPIRLAQQRSRKKQESSGGAFAGRYAILRDGNKDSGCLLILNAGGRALLGPGCRDHGLVVFDPTAWSTARGAIVLRARKGHRITLVPKDGLFIREPAADKPFVLRKF